MKELEELLNCEDPALTKFLDVAKRLKIPVIEIANQYTEFLREYCVGSNTSYVGQMNLVINESMVHWIRHYHNNRQMYLFDPHLCEVKDTGVFCDDCYDRED